LNKIGILGCGWLGLPLAIHLKNEGFTINGSTSSNEKLNQLSALGINAFLIDLPHQFDESFFHDIDALLINIPPATGRQGVNFHLKCIEKISGFIPSTTKIIYVSATSVYPKNDRPIDENVPVDGNADRAKALWQVEEFLLKLSHKVHILRLGGLLGYNRIPGRYFAGKTVDTPDEKVNYIHRDDAISIINGLLKIPASGEIFNGVAPKHPTKKEVYTGNAEKFGFESPVFESKDNQLTKRFIRSDQIVQKLGYSFIYPDPNTFYYTI